MNETFETITGVKVVALVFGFIGAALGISYTPEITKRTAFAALIAGVVCGALGPEGVQALFANPLPMVIKNVVALICGLGGMFIVPGLLIAWKGFATDPWAFIDRLRGLRGGDKGGDKKDGGQP